MYYFMKCGDTAKNIPFEIVDRYEHHILMRSIRYPSYYGISNVYRESFFPSELMQPKTKEEVIRWAENSKDFDNLKKSADAGSIWAINSMEEWYAIKKNMS